MDLDRGRAPGIRSLPPDSLRGSLRVDEAQLKLKLLELFRSPNYQPPVLPVVAVELLELVRRPSVDTREVIELLRQDPFLAGNVLKLAQSPLYGRVPVRSLDDALLRVGMNRVADLFFKASLDLRVFRVKAYDAPMNHLRRHSALVAELVQKVCRVSVGLEQYAFLCGLLHDVGTAASILALSELAPRPPFEQVRASVEAVHEGCSEVVAKLWGLAPDVCTILSLHHRLLMDRRVHPIAAAVAAADRLADEVGVGFYGESDPERFDLVVKELGLDPPTLERLRADAVELSAVIR